MKKTVKAVFLVEATGKREKSVDNCFHDAPEDFKELKDWGSLERRIMTIKSSRRRASCGESIGRIRKRNHQTFYCSNDSLVVEATGLEPTISSTRRVAHLIFKWFLRLFGAFVSEIGAFRCSCKHCFHTVQVCRWSKVWSTHFLNRQSKPKIFEPHTIKRLIVHPVSSYPSAVSIPYFERLVKRLLSTRKNCGAVVKEKPLRKSWIYFRKSAGLPLSSVVCCCADRKGGTTYEKYDKRTVARKHNTARGQPN